MTLLEKIKINIDYLLGKADPSLYAKPYKEQKLSLKDWQERWEIFSPDSCGFYWYGFDSEGNIAQFSSEAAYVPEAFFKDVSENAELQFFFDNLPQITSTRLPENLPPKLKQLAQKSSGSNDFWKIGANKGLFIFEEIEDEPQYKHYRNWIVNNPYELLVIPEKGLKIENLPDRIQKLLEPYHFESLKFADCQTLDVSKYLYCEE